MPEALGEPQTFSEMVLALLEHRFPWLGSDEEANGATTVEELSELHDEVVKRCNPTRRSC